MGNNRRTKAEKQKNPYHAITYESIPDELFKFTKLTYLYCTSRQLFVSTTLCFKCTVILLPVVRGFYTYGLWGTIPSAISKLTALTYLYAAVPHKLSIVKIPHKLATSVFF